MMITDFNFGGVLLPGLLVIALGDFLCLLILLRFLAFSSTYRALPGRPLVNVAAFLILFALLKQGLNAMGL
ncbi:DUF1656 domain-containing protein [Rahnella victoriana]|jgi:succinate dehydrogenase/fumarate reductase cytochrome b subunit|nr:DUF1656 domain-containing protein [Rahnella victoriana]